MTSPHRRKISAIVSRLLEWFALNARDLPWRRTSDAYSVWVSEIMLQQTQVKTVIPYWERWMTELPDLESVARAGEDRIHKLWEGLGYYSRARNLQAAARQMVSQHAGRFPRDFAAILELPGVGRYTAGAVASIAFNEARPILDGNVIRVVTRLFGIEENPREKPINDQLWAVAEELVQESAHTNSQPSAHSKAGPAQLNQSLMELGALVCTPRQPKCATCPLQSLCQAFRSGKVNDIPNLAPRATATARSFVAYVLESAEGFLVRQRPEGVVNAHLWEFPNFEYSADAPNPGAVEVAQKLFEVAPEAGDQLCMIRHSITRYRITLLVFHGKLPARRSVRGFAGTWATREQLHQLAFSSAHKKIVKLL